MGRENRIDFTGGLEQVGKRAGGIVGDGMEESAKIDRWLELGVIWEVVWKSTRLETF